MEDKSLILQLCSTSKWKEFEDWYNKIFPLVQVCRNFLGIKTFCTLPFEFQKGVFEKFIDSQDHNLYQETGFYQLDSLPVTRCEESFEALLIWYFNHE